MMCLGRPKKGEEARRREQLLEHAVRLFAEHGYSNLSLETIAREARVSLRTIYRQFGGKAELFGAVIRHFSDLFVATLPLDPAQAKPIEDILVDFAREYLFRLTRPEMIRLCTQMQGETRQFPCLAAEFYSQGPERTLRRLAQFFAVHQKTGRIAALDPDFLAGQFIGCLRGEWFHRLQYGLAATPGEAEIETRSRQAVDLFLRGCLTAAG
ncbi:transcriptional regulator, TetR family [Methylomagnum ishizawai]|uniref:Transcriptional regulator, TetR family n=1 Tax=Methylomagnum ishizawai TaxID=1760988 RepID=A0A1Y6CY76_9GAMM|nr:TetR/AcrR family transcriptional regulator [Methylomagnum ishizawai]SMF95190.1 transcriptional regulator, TetR family [Methylomagnum ishizawai]